jgi:vacuolar-type H+-ATPase subunit F/Vma7
VALRVVALGTRPAVEGFGLAGAQVLVAEDDAAVRAVWASLGPDVGVALLTRAALDALPQRPEVAPGQPLLVVLPS